MTHRLRSYRTLFSKLDAALSFFALLLLPVAAAPQTVSPETYDVNYIGPRLADPVLQHSKETYVLFGCSYCHGLNLVTRGEATDLMHSRLVGRDQNGNLIGPLLRKGIPQTAKLSPMPQFSDLSDQQIDALVHWIHYARQQARFKELTATADAGIGAADAGKAYFEVACVSCHTRMEMSNAARKFGARKDMRAHFLRPQSIDATASWKIEPPRDPKAAMGRDQHLHLLENYSREDVANLTAYLLSLR